MTQYIFQAVIILLALWLAYETFALSFSRVEIPLQRLPESFNGFRIVLISDIHGKRFKPKSRVVKILKDADVDIIAVTGDFVHKNDSEMINITPFIATLTDIAPVYAVGGNHDYKAGWPQIATDLKNTGVIVLENGNLTISRNGEEIVLAGVQDPSTGRECLEKALPNLPHTGRPYPRRPG